MVLAGGEAGGLAAMGLGRSEEGVAREKLSIDGLGWGAGRMTVFWEDYHSYRRSPLPWDRTGEKIRGHCRGETARFFLQWRFSRGKVG